MTNYVALAVTFAINVVYVTVKYTGLAIGWVLLSPFWLTGFILKKLGYEPTGRFKCIEVGHDWEGKPRECQSCGKRHPADGLHY